MRIASRGKTIAFFITLGACLVGLAVALNVSWIIINWREVVPLVLGVIFFGVIIAGLVVNTIFLVREIRRNEQQDSFLNAVTHELKTPITSIRLYLETLERRHLEEGQRQEFYRVMLEDTDRLLGTVEQVLKAGEERHGKARKNWQEVDFSSLVRDALELARLRHNLAPEALRFGADQPAGVTVMGNPEELRTAVANLFDNAVKYSGDEKDIVVDVLTPDIDTVLLRVRDNGIGIPRRELKRIFKRFYRGVHVGAAQVKGTGLGLFIVRSIARRHGGDVVAESDGEGRGSTFTLRFPRVYRV
ncbi:MAG TPA: HAMP domain-containing sensor histidine kinase [Terriglobales bacterium]|nr:HAMP domain-containing sensor histidine kinase [Terriglobales bacterium]